MEINVKWTESPNLSNIPECYWDEDLLQLDRNYEGKVIDTVKSFWGTTYFVVLCSDNKIREIDINKINII